MSYVVVCWTGKAKREELREVEYYYPEEGQTVQRNFAFCIVRRENGEVESVEEMKEEVMLRDKEAGYAVVGERLASCYPWRHTTRRVFELRV